jgi:hypothetical protein
VLPSAVIVAVPVKVFRTVPSQIVDFAAVERERAVRGAAGDRDAVDERLGPALCRRRAQPGWERALDDISGHLGSPPVGNC